MWSARRSQASMNPSLASASDLPSSAADHTHGATLSTEAAHLASPATFIILLPLVQRSRSQLVRAAMPILAPGKQKSTFDHLVRTSTHGAWPACSVVKDPFRWALPVETTSRVERRTAL